MLKVMNISDLKNKFAIFSIGRCGTTAIQNVLNSLNVKCIGEPFKQYLIKDGKNIPRMVNKEKEFNKILRECGEFDGIKTLHYQLSFPLNKWIFNNFGKIVYMKRKNKLQAAISRAIGSQGGEWHNKQDIYPEINPKEIHFHLGDCEREEKLMNEIDMSNVLEVIYENAFAPSMEKRIQEVNKIFDYLGFKFEATPAVLKIMALNKKVHTSSEYKKIPNIDQIIKLFGSPFDDIKLL